MSKVKRLFVCVWLKTATQNNLFILLLLTKFLNKQGWL